MAQWDWAKAIDRQPHQETACFARLRLRKLTQDCEQGTASAPPSQGAMGDVPQLPGSGIANKERSSPRVIFNHKHVKRGISGVPWQIMWMAMSAKFKASA